MHVSRIAVRLMQQRRLQCAYHSANRLVSQGSVITPIGAFTHVGTYTTMLSPCHDDQFGQIQSKQAQSQQFRYKKQLIRSDHSKPTAPVKFVMGLNGKANQTSCHTLSHERHPRAAVNPIPDSICWRKN